MITELLAQHRLKNTLRDVKTLDGGVPVYYSARISVEMTDPESLSPTSKYVLKERLTELEALRNRIFVSRGVDIFTFPGIFEDDNIKIAPPIAEEINRSRLLIDGLHRSYIARRNGESLVVAHVRNSLTDFEPIGLPISWGEVIERDTQPTTGQECRNLRPGVVDQPASLRQYYRDFSVLGSTGRRPRRGQNG